MFFDLAFKNGQIYKVKNLLNGCYILRQQIWILRKILVFSLRMRKDTYLGL